MSKIDFLEKHCQIRDPLKGAIPLHFRTYQKSLIDSIDSFDVVLLRTARQMGISTTFVASTLYDIITKDNFNVAIVVPRRSYTENYFNMVRYMYSTIYQSNQNIPQISTSRKTEEMTLKNGSGFYFYSHETPPAPISFRRVFFDMYDFWNDTDNIPKQRMIFDDWKIHLLQDKNVVNNIFISTNAPSTKSYFAKLWSIIPYNTKTKAPTTKSTAGPGKVATHLVFPWWVGSMTQQEANKHRNTLGHSRFYKEYEADFMDEKNNPVGDIKSKIINVRLSQEIFDRLKQEITRESLKKRRPETMSEYINNIISTHWENIGDFSFMDMPADVHGIIKK